MFVTAQVVRDWIEDRFGVAYTVGSMYTLLPRLGIRLKVPAAPRHTQGGSPGPDGLEKGGLGARLKAVGLQAGQGIVWGDEMRLGLRGRQVRKVWAPRGVAVSQEVQIGWSYTYVAVALDPMTGRLWWTWQKNMKGEEMARIWGTWAAEPGNRRLSLGRGRGPHGRGHAGRGGAPSGAAAPTPPELNRGRAFLPGVAPGHRGTGLPRTCKPSRTRWNRS